MSDAPPPRRVFYPFLCHFCGELVTVNIQLLLHPGPLPPMPAPEGRVYWWTILPYRVKSEHKLRDTVAPLRHRILTEGWG